MTNDVVKPMKTMEEIPTVVKEPITEVQPSEGTIPAVVPEEITQPVPVGSKTDSELLLKSLQEEREKRRILEQKLKEKELESSALSEDDYSDEGRLLKKEISTLSQEVKSLKEESEFERLVAQYPVLKEKVKEFKVFQADYPRNKMENVVKLFLSENGLIESPRRGLEKPTGGDRTPPLMGITSEEVKTLRETNYRKYEDMLMKGQIKIV